MRINSITAQGMQTPKQNQTKKLVSSFNNFGLRLNSQLISDSVAFTAKLPIFSPNEKMTAHAIEFLKGIGLKKLQPLHIKAESKYLPFLKVFNEEAYKMGSGRIKMSIVEPEIEALKKKHGITGQFDYQKKAIEELKIEGAKFITFDKANCPYKLSGLSKKELKSVMDSYFTNIPKEITDIQILDPKEIFKTVMDLKEGQPVMIRGSREKLSKMVELAEWLYSKNKTQLIDFKFFPNKRYDDIENPIAFLKYADESLLEKVSTAFVTQNKEVLGKDIASLNLVGDDPEIFKGIDPKRISKYLKTVTGNVSELYNQVGSNVPWLLYWAPSSKGALKVYPEFGNNAVGALKQALEDANKINRVGHLEEHINNLEYRANAMNNLLKRGFNSIRFISVDSKTKLPDGKTDLKVGLSPKSFFGSARINMEKFHHKPMLNVPSEEVFSSPNATLTEGKVSATMPLILNGNIVEGIEMNFQKGRAIKVNASKNEAILKEHIATNENADRLGEVALVAGSPLTKMNRIFYSTLLDENAACHIAIGDGYSDVIKGPKALKTAAEIEDYSAQKEYLKKLNINSSTTHDDFMIGGPNVYVYAENSKTKERVQIIKDDKFLL